jgi:hypothetical protein
MRARFILLLKSDIMKKGYLLQLISLLTAALALTGCYTYQKMQAEAHQTGDPDKADYFTYNQGLANQRLNQFDKKKQSEASSLAAARASTNSAQAQKNQINNKLLGEELGSRRNKAEKTYRATEEELLTE